MHGCAPVIDHSQLKTPAPHVIVFSSPFSYDTSKEVDLPKPEPGSFRGLLAGTYTAVYEDDQGTYYRAPGVCVISMTYPSKGQKFLVEGGIWIEKNSAAPKFRLYRISGLSLGTPSPIGDLPPCTPSSQVAVPASDTYSVVNQLATSAVINNPAPISASTAVGTGIGYSLVGAMIEAEKGKLVLLPPPVGDPNIGGKFTRLDQ
jgi:hypothetical protein